MRNMSFALTTDQIRNRTKTVTRRMGWTFLKSGDLLQPVAKCQGLKKGEMVQKIGGPIRVVSVRREALGRIEADDVAREGFPQWNAAEFCAFFSLTHKCPPHALVTRIEFDYVESP